MKLYRSRAYWSCTFLMLFGLVGNSGAQNATKKTKQFQLKEITPIDTALQYYPELQHTQILFKYKKRSSPLAASIGLFNIFKKPQNRKYNITISNLPRKKIRVIAYDSLSNDAKVGVIGHELAHIAYFNTLSSWQYLWHAVKNFNKYNVDRSEFATDKRCIQHGLGKNLFIWSTEVRQKLGIKKWGGAGNPDAVRERYMNPETIIMQIEMYNNSLQAVKK
jgi:predicted metallopeptidase